MPPKTLIFRLFLELPCALNNRFRGVNGYLADESVAGGEPLLFQGLGQMAGALTGPSQRRHRIASRVGGD